MFTGSLWMKTEFFHPTRTSHGEKHKEIIRRQHELNFTSRTKYVQGYKINFQPPRNKKVIVNY
jgi:hypothetical protein